MLYYVYHHTGDEGINYIGHGFGDRAWSITNRDIEYKEYLLNRVENGETPQDWVVLLHVGLTKKEARDTEAKLLVEHRPRFNRNDKYKALRFTKEHLLIAQELRENNYTYNCIADKMGFAAMTVHRALAGGTIAHQRP